MNQRLAQWITEARFSLNTSATITTQIHRNKTWTIIYSNIENESYFLEENLYKLLSDSQSTSVAEAFNAFNIKKEEQQGLCIALLHLLKQGLITCNHSKLNEVVLLGHAQNTSKSSVTSLFSQFLKNPLLAKFNLFSADGTATQLSRFVPSLFSKHTAITVIALFSICILLVITHLDNVGDFYQNQFYSPYNLILLTLLYLPMKTLHEFAHATVTKYYGGHVGKFGVLFFGFLPAAFVDVCSSAYFASRKQRILVSLAGIFAEITIATLALIIFITLTSVFGLNTSNSIAYHFILLCLFDLAFIGFVSSLLFNANPLMRYDGYYVCSELLQIPNLASRARQRFKHNVNHWLFGLTPASSSTNLKSEIVWLNIYGCASFFYRIMITVLVLIFLISHVWWLGLAIAVFLLARSAVGFVRDTLFTLYFRCQHHNKLKRFFWVVAAPISLVLIVLFLPFSFGFSSTALLNDSQFRVRSPSDGTVVRFLPTKTTELKSGDTLLELANPDLVIEKKINALEIEEQTIRYADLAFRSPALAEEFAANIQDLNANQRDIDEKLKNLRVSIPYDGTLIKNPLSPHGRYIEKGEATVTAVYYSKINLETLISQEDLQRLPENFTSVKAVPFTNPEEKYIAEIVSIESKARGQIPSLFFSAGLGGSINTDWRDSSGLTSQSPTFLLSVQLPPLPKDSVLSYRWQLIFSTKPQSVFNYLWRNFSQWLRQKIDHN